MLAKGERNQDIHALINYERTLDFGRITTVKKDATIQQASDEEIEFFKKRKQSFDPVTGLNLYDDERLIRAREAMILAVTIFNSSTYKFKTGMFAILANIGSNVAILMFEPTSGRSDNHSLTAAMSQQPTSVRLLGKTDLLEAEC